MLIPPSCKRTQASSLFNEESSARNIFRFASMLFGARTQINRLPSTFTSQSGFCGCRINLDIRLHFIFRVKTAKGSEFSWFSVSVLILIRVHCSLQLERRKQPLHRR